MVPWRVNRTPTGYFFINKYSKIGYMDMQFQVSPEISINYNDKIEYCEYAITRFCHRFLYLPDYTVGCYHITLDIPDFMVGYQCIANFQIHNFGIYLYLLLFPYFETGFTLCFQNGEQHAIQ